MTSNGNKRLIRYLDEEKGEAVGDMWVDIPEVNSMAEERVEYANKKPEKLLERIIRASCPEGGLVADFNGGSGTTATVFRCNRQLLDQHRPGQARLHDQQTADRPGGQAFFYQAIGDYQIEAAKATLGRDFRIGDLLQIVLSLYGALPCRPRPTRSATRVRLRVEPNGARVAAKPWCWPIRPSPPAPPR